MRHAARRAFGAAVLAAALAGCEISSEMMDRSEPPSADGRPYPNIGTVPPNPRRAQPTASAEQLRVLEAERRASQEAAAKLQAAAIPDAPPPPVQLPPLASARTSAVQPAAVPPPAGSVLGLEFTPGSSRLSDSQRDQIRRTAAIFDRQDSRVRVVGVWLREADRRIARARAQVVAGEIIRQGVPASRVDIRDGLSPGGSAPVGNRVEILVDY